MQTIRDYASINGAQLYYEVAGEGEPLAMLHGFTLDMRMWDAQFDVFAEHFRVLRYDLRGYGKSSLPDQPYCHADDLAALMTYLDMPKAHVMGLSMGGGIALDFACLHPGRLNKLVLVDSTVGGFDGWTMNMRFGAKTDRLEMAKARWLASPLFAPAQSQPAVAAALKQIVDDWSGFQFLHDDFDTFPPPPVIERLSGITAPTLVVVGELDHVDFRRIADILASRIPDARLVVLPTVGHMSNMEAPEAFNRVALAFLSNL